MAKSSIHIKGVKPNSETHNKRLKDYNYVRKDLTHLNESWEAESISDARKRINRTYRKAKEKKIQKNAVTIKEGVVNLNPDNTMEDLHALSEKLYEKFKIKTIQIHIHRDEGHAKSKVWKQNLHAHMVFDWTDEQGTTLKLGMYEMVEIQNIVAETLRMERGQKSDKEHLNALAYKVQQAEKELEELQQQMSEQKNVINSLNLDVQNKNEQIQSLRKENQNLKAENAELAKKKDFTESNIEEANNKLQFLIRQINAKKLEEQEAQKRLEKVREEEKEKSKIAGELLVLRQEEEKRKKKNQELQEENQKLQEEKQKLQEEIDEKKANLDYLAGEGEMEDLAARLFVIGKENREYQFDSWEDVLSKFNQTFAKELRSNGKSLGR